jgi:hypothetical protein
MVLQQAAALGRLHPHVDPVPTADLVVAGVTGLSRDVVHGTRSARDVRAIARQTTGSAVLRRPGVACRVGNPPVMFKV